jgi:predicted Zn-dependent peptidase
MSDIRTRRLACGMPLIVETMPGVSSAALSWLVPAGTSIEPENRLGIASMLAELLMRGAGGLESREHADALDRLGVGRSTDASGSHLRIGATMLGSRVLEALPLIVDMVRRPRFDAGAIEPARDLALQALDALQDDPQERAVTRARARHFPTPFDRSTHGEAEGIKAVTRDDILSLWDRRATPHGSILAIAGAVDGDAIEHRLNRLLDGWTGEAADPFPTGSPTRGYEHEEDETNQVQIILMSDAPPEPDHNAVLERVVANILSGGMSGRLFTEVREKRGLCYAVSAGYGGGKLFGTLMGYVGTTPERAQESLDVMVAELARINSHEGTPTREEFDRAIVGMKSRLVFSGESTSSRASALAGDVYRLGRPRSLGELAREIDAVTLDRVAAYLRTRTLGTMTIQTLGPVALTPPSA